MKIIILLFLLIASATSHDYKARLLKVVDGDTFDFDVSLGYQTHRIIRLRLLGIDVYEKTRRDGQTQAEKIKGLQAKVFVEKVLSTADEIKISHECQDTGKYGRLLCDVWYVKGFQIYSLTTELRANGFEKTKKEE